MTSRSSGVTVEQSQEVVGNTVAETHNVVFALENLVD